MESHLPPRSYPISDWCSMITNLSKNSSIIDSNDVSKRERERKREWEREKTRQFLSFWAVFSASLHPLFFPGRLNLDPFFNLGAGTRRRRCATSQPSCCTLLSESTQFIPTGIVYTWQRSMTMGHVHFLSLCPLSNKVDKKTKLKGDDFARPSYSLTSAIPAQHLLPTDSTINPSKQCEHRPHYLFGMD